MSKDKKSLSELEFVCSKCKRVIKNKMFHHSTVVGADGIIISENSSCVECEE